jgi:hypothetical protein
VSGVGFHDVIASSSGEGLLLGDTGDRNGLMFGVDAVDKGKVLSLHVIEFVNHSLYEPFKGRTTYKGITQCWTQNAVVTILYS